ncbi:hypothetical protein ACIGKG_34080 [Streptomyces rochei]|uniref:hypothetical protein n=1 Tax=Streptomyces rochei TaxID=1928 RepID=UPI0037D6FE4D
MTAELLGVGPGVFLASETLVTGCFTFTVTPEARGHRRGHGPAALQLGSVLQSVHPVPVDGAPRR